MKRLIPLGLLLAALSLGGCYRYVTSRVTVVDGETGEPIPRALVSVNYSGKMFDFAIPPHRDSGCTDQEGVVELRVSANPDRIIYPIWDCEPAGYLPGGDGLEYRQAGQEVAALVASGRTDSVVQLTLRRRPRPKPVVLIRLPDGYRGYVHVCKPGKKAMKTPPGQLRFECVPDAHGRCELPWTWMPVLENAPAPPTYEFEYSDGTAIPWTQRLPQTGDLLAAWGMGFVSDGCQVFVIATETEAAAENRLQWPSGAPDRGASAEWQARVRKGPFGGTSTDH